MFSYNSPVRTTQNIPPITPNIGISSPNQYGRVFETQIETPKTGISSPNQYGKTFKYPNSRNANQSVIAFNSPNRTLIPEPVSRYPNRNTRYLTSINTLQRNNMAQSNVNTQTLLSPPKIKRKLFQNGGKTIKRKSKNIVKWKNIKPHSESSRKNMKRKYGSNCFLEPKTLKYPICNKFNGKQECMGLYAADYYLNLNMGKLNKKLNKKINSNEKNVYTKKLKKYNKLKSKSDRLKKRLCTKKKK